MKKFEGVTGESDMQPLMMSEEDYKASIYERYNCIDEQSGRIEEVVKQKFKVGDYVRKMNRVGVVVNIQGGLYIILFENDSRAWAYSASELEPATPANLLVNQETIEWMNTPMGPAGGTKHDNGKPDLSLLPSVFVKEVARALMYGENKYGRYNFEKGFDTHRLLGACLRHVYAWNEGEDTDPESGISHLAHAAASIGMLLRCLELGTATDTRSRGNGPRS